MPTVCARTAHTWLFEAMTPSLVTSEFLLPASAFRHQSATDAGNCGSIPFDSFFFPLVPPDSLRLAEAGLSQTACILLSLSTPASRACQASGTEGWARISEGEHSSGRSRGYQSATPRAAVQGATAGSCHGKVSSLISAESSPRAVSVAERCSTKGRSPGAQQGEGRVASIDRKPSSRMTCSVLPKRCPAHISETGAKLHRGRQTRVL